MLIYNFIPISWADANGNDSDSPGIRLETTTYPKEGIENDLDDNALMSKKNPLQK